MSEIDTGNRARGILARANKWNRNIGVFLVGDRSVRAALVDGDLFLRAIESEGAKLVGIYTPSCDPQWLEDDLDYVLGGRRFT